MISARLALGRLAGAALVLVVVACATGESALDRAPDQVKRTVSDVEEAQVSRSYRFRYTAISSMFMSCLSGIEDLDGVVDANHAVMKLTSSQRAGDVYSLDGELLISNLLLRRPGTNRGFTRLRLDPSTDSAATAAIERALGITFSVFIASGAWPTHPNELLGALIPIATEINELESGDPSLRAIRIVLDPATYRMDLARIEVVDEAPPVIDAYVAADGGVMRLVVRDPDPTDPRQPGALSEGYTIEYDFDATISVAPPTGPDVEPMDAAELPDQTTPIPCELES